MPLWERQEVQEVPWGRRLTRSRHRPNDEDRPRERLDRLGPEALTTEELLSALVGSGGTCGSARDVARTLLTHVDGSLRRLRRTTPGALRQIAGVGPATATRVLAALELGRRAGTEPWRRTDPLRGAADVYRLMEPRMRDLVQEEFHALLLNAQHALIRDVTVTRGILDASLVHPREVFRAAVSESAAAVILVHNHPSGDPTPSPEDRAVTTQMEAAGQALGIPVLDHVIVAGSGYRSLTRGGGGS